PAPSQSITIPANGTQTVNFVLTEILAAVSGTVVDNQVGAPILGATVTLTDSTGKTVGGPLTTGADGTYSFTSIPASQTAANFNISVTPPNGYFSNGIIVSLSLGDNLTGKTIPVDEKGTITGLVTDGSTGQPLPNVSLTVTDTTTGAAPANLAPVPLVTNPGTTIGPDGKTSNYIATFTLTPGHSYSVSATKPNYNPAAAVKVTPSPLTNGQAGRADLQLTSGIGTLGGLVSDATTNTAVGGATITVTSVNSAGASTVVATFTTNSSVSPAPDGKTQGVNYNGPVAQGAYTVTLTFGSRTPVVQKITVVGGQFNRLDFTGANGAPPVYTFPAGLQFLSTPYDYSSLSFDTLFGILNTAPTGTPPNGNRTHVAVWDPTVSQYAIDPNAPADSLRLGVGYWVFLKNSVPVTVQGAVPTAAYVPVALHPAWNQIGVPNIKGIPVSSLMFDNGAGGMISFAAAVGSQYHIVAPTLYSYDGSGYQPVTQSSVLQPWKAYWIQVYSGATIEIPTK
ncbi:MAG: carboxypeptidase regulatory-like domain-containing protein, partial [Actinomycetota bacterium]|nr:carboxypeptidase regulatory-like domain-containing protein [Actinomycetota bacterium]